MDYRTIQPSVGPFNMPTNLVVSRDGDLFIVDGSLFVTAGGVNPTPTIQALALRVADYIAHERGDLK